MTIAMPRRQNRWRWLTQVIAWIVMLCILAILAVAVVIPRLVGATPYTILTSSMTPGMPPGTLVVVKPIEPAHITSGMVITYQLRSGDPMVVTHRVVSQGVASDGTLVFRTQGDANKLPDANWVRPVQIKGERLYSIQHLGRVSNLLTSTQRQTMINIVVVGLLGYAAAMVIASIRDKRRRGASADV